MNPELRDRSLMVGLLLISWAVLVYLKTVLNAAVLPDLNAIIAQVQVLMGGVVGYHVGTGAGSAPLIAPLAPTAPAAIAGRSLPSFTVLLAILALGAALLSGCSATMLDNRVACTVASDKAFFVSEYGPIGVAATIADADRAAICSKPAAKP